MDNKTDKEAKRNSKVVQHAVLKSKIPRRTPLFLPNGSLYPKERTKVNWKEKFETLQKENRLLKKEIAQQKEKILQYERDQAKLFENYDEFVQMVQLRYCENVQIGDYNTQVVQHNCDVSLIRNRIIELENNIKEVIEKRKLVEGYAQDQAPKLEEKMESPTASIGKPTCDSWGQSRMTDMQQLTVQIAETEMACPDCSIARISEQITELQLKLDNFNELCSSKRVSSSLSLDDRKLTRTCNNCDSRRKLDSQHNLQMQN